MFRGNVARFPVCISYLTGPIRGPAGSLRKDEVQGPAGLINLLDGGQALFVGCRHPELMNDAHEFPHALMERGSRAFRVGAPGAAQLLSVVRHVSFAGFGEGELGAPALTNRCDQIFVDELLQRRVNRTRAGTPGPGSLFGDCLNQPVPVGGGFGEEGKNGGADIAPVGPAWAARPETRSEARSEARAKAPPEPATAMSVGSAAAPAALETPSLRPVVCKFVVNASLDGIAFRSS